MAAAKRQTAVKLIFIIVAALVLFALVTYYNRTRAPERFTSTPSAVEASMQPLAMRYPAAGQQAEADEVRPMVSSSSATASTFSALEPRKNEQYRPVSGDDGSLSIKEAFPQDRISPEELLPKDAANTKWAQVNPAGQGSVKDQNFLTAGYHLGVDTQGSSLRNASHDLRSEPANPRYKVSIWNTSSIEPDMHRKPLV